MLNPDSIWTRVRKLEDEYAEINGLLSHAGNKIDRLQRNREWEEAYVEGQLVAAWCLRMKQIEDELDMISPLADGFEKVCKRMEELEAAAREQGWRGDTP